VWASEGKRVGVSAYWRVGVGVAPKGDVSADGRIGVSAWSRGMH
jgi:hypothetical protein